ncbi:cholinephosphotransferase 1-like [Sycon ciliatum]|uniref:cholinephosphotransferase 1-like n=1 Tax=Sycon ciliatum TaxID=27933 RepID=UPI0020ABD8AF|eukprot:scpid57052/ scgid18045/ Choline/ethanolaminephosphotransferase 1
MLSPELLRGLDAHKYSCSGRSLTEPAFQIYWNWLVLLMPRWLAPNLITFIGLLCNLFGSGVLLWHTPHLTEAAPWWAYVTVAVSLFIYQSLDAIDGKQARRTNNSSPLGELFDHGCDALSGAFLTLCTLSVLRVGDMPLVMHSSLMLALSVFYSAHWRAYTSGTLQFGLIDVTEAQLVMIIAQLVAAFAGPDVLTMPVFGVSVSLIVVAVINVSGGLVLVNNVIQSFRSRNTGHCRSNSWFTPAIPFAVFITSTTCMLLTSPADIGVVEPALVGVFYGCISAQLASRLVVAHMSKTPMELFDTCLVPMFCALVNTLLGAPLPERPVVIVAALVAAANLFGTAAIMCREIAQHMGIYVFTVGKRND